MSLDLVKALYNPKTRLPDEVSFYEIALKDIEYFGISPQVYDLLKNQGRLEQTPLFFRNKLKQNYTVALYQNLFIKNQLEVILNSFEKNSIDVIPLKGIKFAEKYFGHIGARPTSDIDLLIRKVDLEKAIECVKSLGFTIEEEQIPNHFHYNLSKEINGSSVPLTVELHWNLIKDRSAEFNIEEFWNHAQPIQHYHYIKELSDEHTFYMICIHGWRHNLVSLKYFIDIIQMINILNHKLDYVDLLKNASKHKTVKRIIRTLSIVYQNFPILENIKEFPQKRSIPFWDYDAYRNLSSNKLKVYADYINFQFFSYDTIKHSLLELWNWIYPSKSEVSFELGISVIRYPYLKLYIKRFKSFRKSVDKYIKNIVN